MHIGNLKPWDLFSVLTQKYNWSPLDAEVFADFLLPMLEYDIRFRATAEECLQHPWIRTNHGSENYAKIIDQLRIARSQAVSAIMKQNPMNELIKDNNVNLLANKKNKLKYSASTKLPGTTFSKDSSSKCCLGVDDEVQQIKYKSDATATSSSSAMSSSNSSTKKKQLDYSSGNQESECEDFSKLVMNHNSGEEDCEEEEDEEYMDNYIRLVNEYSKTQNELFTNRIYQPPMAHKRLIQHRHSL